MRGLLLLLLFCPTYLCLRIVSLGVPKSVSLGDPFWLSCEYDLEGEKLESVRWYKDDWEIYRFFPNDTEEPCLQKYNIPIDSRVFLDSSLSNSTHLCFWRSNLDNEGTYRCVVSSSGFQTIYEEKMLRMNVIPSEVPRIYGSSKEYKMGDIVNLTCVFGPSKRLSQLVWYINWDRTPAESVSPLNTPPGTASPPLTTELPLYFVLGPRVQSVTCVAVVPQEPLFSTNDVRFHAGGAVNVISIRGTSLQFPMITGVPERYTEGDIVDLNCYAGKPTHRYKLEWSINDEPAPPEFLSGDEGSSLELRFHPTADHWKGEKMSLKCKGTFTGKAIATSVHFPFGKEQRKLKFRCRPPYSHQLCNGCCYLSTLPDPPNN